MRRVLILLVAVLAAACSRPSVYERFERLQDGSGVCRFEIDMSDSSSTYDIDFYSRLDGRNRVREPFPLTLVWTSPSGTVYSEVLSFPMDERSVRFSDAVSTQLQIPYRSFMRPVESGIWTLEVGVDSVRGLCGIGIICERKSNGTR